MGRFSLEAHACADPLKIHPETIQNLPDDDDGKDALVQIILDREAEYDAEQRQLKGKAVEGMGRNGGGGGGGGRAETIDLLDTSDDE